MAASRPLSQLTWIEWITTGRRFRESKVKSTKVRNKQTDTPPANLLAVRLPRLVDPLTTENLLRRRTGTG